MVFILPRRLLCCSSLVRGAATAVNKSLLAQLRKSTGYSISHCKNALVQHDNDVEKASEWLAAQAQTEGWAKASKLSGRSTKQGLLGIAVCNNNSQAAIMELNCETDFVARNSLFVELASEITQSCLATKSTVGWTDSDNSTLCKEMWSSEQLSALSHSDGKSLADRVALTIGLCGENMALARAVKVSSGSGVQLYGYTHPGPPTGVVAGAAEGESPLLGKFGAVVAVRQSKYQEIKPDPTVMKQLCLQVIGMNPECIGTPEELQRFAEEEAAQKEATETAAAAEANTTEASDVNQGDKAPKDKFLLLQNWMEDEDLTVTEILDDAGLEVVDFIRMRVGGESE